MTDLLNIDNNNNFFKLLVQSIDEGLVLVNKDREIVYINKRTEDLFNYTKDELIGKEIEILIPLKHHKQHAQKVKDYASKPSKKRMGTGRILEATKKGGDNFYVEIGLNHIELNNQQFFIALITDVSKRVLAEQQIKELNLKLEEKVKTGTKELEKSQMLYAAVARNFPNGTINVFDKDLNYIFAEGRELHNKKIASQKMIGTSFLKRLPEKIRPKIHSELQKVFLGQKIDFEIKINDQYYSINAVPLENEFNKIDNILMVETNITSPKIVSQKLEKALINEKEINEMKSRFVSMASHEFRTPLSTILSSVSLINSYIHKEKFEHTDKHIKRIKSSVKGLTDILNDFLSTDKLESKKINLNIEKIHYPTFATDITEELQALCQDGQKIISKINIDSEYIVSDQNILKNILYNLISNATKYSKEGQEIHFNSILKEGQLTFEIIDFGIGIPKEEQKNLFNRFFRAKNALNIKGTGLGLNIVNSYLDLLKGSITFDSEENIGTTFIIKIPLNHE